MSRLAVFFLLTYVISWVLWLPLITSQPPIQLFHQLGALGPLIAAVITTYLFEGRRGLETLAKSIVRFDRKWILLAFITPFAIFFLSLIIASFMHAQLPILPLLFQSQEYPTLGIAYWLVSIICYGFGEQVGWRGFALPHLMEKGRNALYASTILSMFWALWHIPLFWYPNSGYYTMNTLMIVGWYGSLLLSSYLLTWIFNTSKKSIAAVAVFHGTIDIVVTSKAAENDIVQIISMILMILGVLVVVISGKSLRGVRHRQNS